MKNAPSRGVTRNRSRVAKTRYWLLGGLFFAVALALLAWGSRHDWRASPELRGELLQRARFYWSDRRLDEAEAALLELSRIGPPASVEERLLRAQVAKERGKLDDAIAALEGVPDSDPDAALIWRNRGLLEFERNRALAAESALLHAIAMNAELPEARRGLIDLYAIQGRKGDLAAQFKALAHSTALNFDDLYLWCLGRRHDVGPAEIAAKLEAILRNEPSDQITRLALAENHRRLGRLGEALKDLAPLPAADPVARAARARLAIDRGSADEAASLLADGLSGDPALERLRGRLALGRGDVAAVNHFRLALAADPNDRDTLFGLGQSLRLSGQAAAAAPYLEAARARDHLEWLVQNARSSFEHDDPRSLTALGDACRSLGRFPEAQGWYRLALARDPLSGDIQKRLFELDAKLNETAK